MRGVKIQFDFNLVDKLIKENKSYREIGEILGVHQRSITRSLKNQAFETPTRVIKIIDKNEDFFENIDSEIKAYLLGYFTADGCVYDSGRIGICLKKEDVHIVELFKKFISPNGTIEEVHNSKGATNRQSQVLLRISSTKIVKDLEKYGIVPRKTYAKIKFPDISNELLMHFIRGFMDGDGCIHIRKYKHHTISLSFSNGDKTILEEIKNYFGKGRLYENKTHAKLEIDHKESAVEILRELYKNANYYLKRKKDKFDIVNAEVIAKSKTLATP